MESNKLKEITRKTANTLFGGGIKMDPPFQLWREFDSELAKDMSLHITGKLYSRNIISLQERQMVAVAALASLGKPDELKLHINGALNVGVEPRKVAEVLIQISTYAGVPAMNEGLTILKDILIELNQWPLATLDSK